MGKIAAIPISEKNVDKAIDQLGEEASLSNITQVVTKKGRRRLKTGNLSKHTIIQLVKTKVSTILAAGKRHGRYSNTNGIWRRLE